MTDLINTYCKVREESGSCCVSAVKNTMFSISVLRELEDRDRFLFRLHDPILRDTCPGVVCPFDNDITLDMIWADNFYYEVSP
jgi:hypothetical protein